MRRNEVTMWKYYAVLSAVFAAATAIFAKLGLKNVDSNLATAIRMYSHANEKVLAYNLTN